MIGVSDREKPEESKARAIINYQRPKTKTGVFSGQILRIAKN